MINTYFKELEKLHINSNIINNISEFNTFLKSSKNKNTFNLFHTNIRSLDKNLDELKILISQLEINFDIIVCTETRNIEYLDLYCIDNFEIYFNNSKYNANDGVIVYVNNRIKHLVDIKIINNFHFLRVECKVNNEIFGITSIYKSPVFNDDIFINNLETHSF